MSSTPWTIQPGASSDAAGYVEDQINQYNVDITGYDDYQPLGLYVRDDQGAVIAGLTGYTWGGFCEVGFLWVHPNYRQQGLGRQLLAAAEAKAARRGCGVVILDSYSFQAPDFYRKLGYTVVGIYEGVPEGYQRFHLEKRLK